MADTATSTTAVIDEILDRLCTKIASDHLGIETLEVRNSDQLDFHEVSVVSVRRALAVAFEAGRIAGRAS